MIEQLETIKEACLQVISNNQNLIYELPSSVQRELFAKINLQSNLNESLTNYFMEYLIDTQQIKEILHYSGKVINNKPINIRQVNDNDVKEQDTNRIPKLCSNSRKIRRLKKLSELSQSSFDLSLDIYDDILIDINFDNSGMISSKNTEIQNQDLVQNEVISQQQNNINSIQLNQINNFNNKITKQNSNIKEQSQLLLNQITDKYHNQNCQLLNNNYNDLKNQILHSQDIKQEHQIKLTKETRNSLLSQQNIKMSDDLQNENSSFFIDIGFEQNEESNNLQNLKFEKLIIDQNKLQNAIYEQEYQAQKEYCFRCQFQINLLQIQDNFICSKCLLTKLNPLKQIIKFLGLVEFQIGNGDIQQQFYLQNNEIQYDLEIRCIKMSQENLGEQTFPHHSQIKINGEIEQEILPLKYIVSQQKREDNSIYINLSQKQNIILQKNFTISFCECKSDIGFRKKQNGDLYIFGLYLVKEQNTNEIIETIKLYDQSSYYENEISIKKQKISLICVQTFQQIQIPVKGQFCMHQQCFCLRNYLELMRTFHHKKFTCPICNNAIINFVIDKYQQKIIDQLKEKQIQVDYIILNEFGQLDQFDQLYCKLYSESGRQSIMKADKVFYNQEFKIKNQTNQKFRSILE